MSEFNILFTSAGRRVSLIRLFRDALDRLGVPGRLIAADLRKDAPAGFVADHAELVPLVTSAEYVDYILKLCDQYRVKLVVPLIDTELPVLAKHRDAFVKRDIVLLVSSPETVRICDDKRKTADFFRDTGFSTPEIFDYHQIVGNPGAYPVLLKPARGSSSVGVQSVRDIDELKFFHQRTDQPLLQKLIQGDEYTLDVLVDDQGTARMVVPRLRISVRAGEISKGVTVFNRDLVVAGKQIAEALPGAFGPLTIQGIVDSSGCPHFIEINPRFGGGFPLSAQAGADYPGWIIEMTLGRQPQIDFYSWQRNLAMLRFDDAVFVPGHELT